MWGSRRNASPIMRHDTEASIYEANTAPLRGSNPPTKPVGRRMKYSPQISKKDNGEIVIEYGNRPLMVYYPDDTIRIFPLRVWGKDNHYVSTSHTRNALIGRTLGTIYGVFNHDARAWIGADWVDSAGVAAFGSVPIGVEGLLIRYKGLSYYTCAETPKRRQMGLDRKACNALKRRPEYATARTYVSAFMKVLPQEDPSLNGGDYSFGGCFPKSGPFSAASYAEAFGNRKRPDGTEIVNHRGQPVPYIPKQLKFMSLSEKRNVLAMLASQDTEENYKGMLTLMYSTNHTLSAAIKQFDTLLYQVHAPEVVVEREARGFKCYRDPIRHYLHPHNQE